MKSLFATIGLGSICGTILPGPQRARKPLALFTLLALSVFIACNNARAQTAHVSDIHTAPSSQALSQPHPLAARDFGSVNVGGAGAPITLTFTFDAAGTIAAPSVVTQGAVGLDFADAGTGTCTTKGNNHTYNTGDTCTVDVTFTPKYPGVRFGAAVLRDNSGSVIATGYVQGTGTGPQVSFPPGIPSILSLSGFTSPWAVAADSAGNLYIANAVVGYDYPENTVVKETWNGTGYTASTIATGLGYPTGLAIDGAGNVYIADQDGFTVYKETPVPDGTYIQSIVDGTLGTVAGIAVDGVGNVYVGRGGIGVEKETLSGGTYTRSEIFYRFYGAAIAVDTAGNLYIGDLSNIGIRKEVPSGSGYTETIIASGQSAYRIVLDGVGNIYFSDGSQISKLAPSANGYQQSTVATGINDLQGLAVDALGNLYYSSYDQQSRTGNVWKVDVADPPSLNFATTVLGATSGDSPQTVTLSNIGNADLTFPAPAGGSNPALSPSFTLNDSAPSACPQVSADASSGTLASGASCELSISFVPVSSGNISGSLVLTDNALNAASPGYTTQTIALSGTATDTKPSPSISVVSSAGSAFLSNPVTFTVVATNSAGTPTGSVTFYDGPNQLGTATLSAGTASYTTSSLAMGSHSITAAYSGDAVFSPVTSSAINETIEDFTIMVPSGSSSSATVLAGGQVSYTIAIAPSGGTNTAAAITLALSGLPTTVTSSFSPSSVAANSAPTNVTLKLTASSSASSDPEKNSLFRNPIPIAFGLLLTFSIGRIRRGSRSWRGTLSVLLLGLAGLAGLAALTACGSNGSNSSGGASSPTPQHYTITVTAASGSLSHSTTLTLTVQ